MKNFEDYKSNNRENNRKIVEPNKIKTEIINEIDKVKDENKSIGIILDIMLNTIGITMHEKWICGQFESGEDNFYRTYRNIKKCKERTLLEVLDYIFKFGLEESLDLKLLLDKHDSETEEKFDLIIIIKYDNLRTYINVNYKSISKYINLPDNIEIAKYEIKNMIKYNNIKLGKQQYFDESLREKLEHVDKLVSELIKLRNNIK